MDCLRKLKPGILLAFATACISALSSVLAGIIVKDIDAETPVLLTNMFQAILAFPVMMWKHKWVETKKVEWALLIVISLLLAGTFYTFTDSNKRIPPVDTMAIAQLQVVFISIIAHFWLKERLGLYEMALIVVIVTGVFLVVQPEFSPMKHGGSTQAIYGYLEALGSCLLASVAYSIVRKLQDTDPFFMVVIQGIVAASSMLAIASFKLGSPEGGLQWAYTISAAACGAVSNLCCIVALNLEEAATVNAIIATVVVFTEVFQILFMGIYPNWEAILGAFVIVVSLSLFMLKTRVFRIWRQVWNRGGTKDSRKDLEDETRL